jgi:hypothetical protein
MNIGANYLREHVSEDTRVHYVTTKGGGGCQQTGTHGLLMNVKSAAALVLNLHPEHLLHSASPAPRSQLAELVEQYGFSRVSARLYRDWLGELAALAQMRRVFIRDEAVRGEKGGSSPSRIGGGTP